MAEMTQHERMVSHLAKATEALERHRGNVQGGVSSHLEDAAKIGTDDVQGEAVNSGND